MALTRIGDPKRSTGGSSRGTNNGNRINNGSDDVGVMCAGTAH